MVFAEFVSIISFQAVREEAVTSQLTLFHMVEVPHEYSLSHLELASVLKICFS